jgi:hypothetical protein
LKPDIGNHIEFCLDKPFFGLSINYEILNPPSTYSMPLFFEYLDSNGNWSPYVYRVNDSSRVDNYLNTEVWYKKTQSEFLTWNPTCERDWGRKYRNNTTGFWFRVSNYTIYDIRVRWAVCSGYSLWNSMEYQHYSIEGTLPSSEGDDRYDYMVPITVEYDIDNKCIIGSMWNYNDGKNNYFPFRIHFDKDLIMSKGEFEVDGKIEFLIYEDGYNYSNTIKSIAKVSSVDSKAVIVDPADRTKAAKFINIKNIRSGSELFTFGIG